MAHSDLDHLKALIKRISLLFDVDKDGDMIEWELIGCCYCNDHILSKKAYASLLKTLDKAKKHTKKGS